MNKTVIQRMIADRNALAAQLARLDAAIETVTRYSGIAANGHTVGTTEADDGPETARRKPMTAAQRRAVSVRMRRYWRARRKGGK